MKEERKFKITQLKRAYMKAKDNFMRTGDMEFGLQMEMFADSCCNQYETTATNFRSKRIHESKY